MPFAIRFAAAFFLVNLVTIFFFMNRGIRWSFDLYPSTQCEGDGQKHSGMGSTGCRADLNTLASAYRLNTVVQGCQMELFENTMCEHSEPSDMVDLSTGANCCRAPTTRRYGSYQVTCDGARS
ncbi:hypothetical protein N7448_011116 [Penicillium atrosanguineum]|uniref:Uncharacterized protein n=1 Tax=Penicillium atrosanguineum TaxID=1132637 RepID=A0A9W9KTF5_9EURO|nr:hypothetical protein N7448_011116 [Penicillium atrosanguineum]KAJ5144268.1 hypothetical protein N7526_001776 [Penicillium atrosanguineum]KAJ5318275.1 hypothetical protein N7476_004695 [Penicillium atrosanguineum]